MPDKTQIQTNCAGPASPWATALGMLTAKRSSGGANGPFPALTPVYVDLMFDSFNEPGASRTGQDDMQSPARTKLNLETT